MLPKHIALVSLSNQLTPTELSQTAAALQKQATRDLGPIWNIQATVDYFPDLKSVPLGYWPIIVTENINEPGAAGYHTDKHHQPFSLVELDDSWQLTCSHEMCEMLVDPYGNKMVSAGSKDLGLGKVNFLVEVCDPCEDASFAYSINGILVSDFYTPNYFDPQAVPGVRYCYTGSITKPCEVLKNGYLSWQDPVTKKWHQATHFGTSITVNVLKGMNDYGSSLRSQVDRVTHNPNHSTSFREASSNHASIQTGVFKAGKSMSTGWAEEIEKYIKRKRGPVKTKAASSKATLNVKFTNSANGYLEADIIRNGVSESDRINVKDGNQDKNSIVFQNVSAYDTLILAGFVAGGSVSVSIDRNTFPSLIGTYQEAFNDSVDIREEFLKQKKQK